jgi:TnpA family transposase
LEELYHWTKSEREERWRRHGRIVKSIYILRYIQDEKLRRAVQLQLNRGEARHTLARWLFFANRGEFRDGDLNEIMRVWLLWNDGYGDRV